MLTFRNTMLRSCNMAATRAAPRPAWAEIRSVNAQNASPDERDIIATRLPRIVDVGEAAGAAREKIVEERLRRHGADRGRIEGAPPLEGMG